MAVFGGGQFEAIATNLIENSNPSNTSATNPFGLKDFAKLLDNKFGNSAFSDNLLSAPKGNSNKIASNPFDTDGKWTRPSINDTSFSSTKAYSIKEKTDTPKYENIFGKTTTPVTDNMQGGNSSIFGEASVNSISTIFEGIQINKGTGMAKGSSGLHKLDFCY